MTSIVSLSPDALSMIECRLDMLDRILMSSGVGRGERINIVQSVEDQIHELIERRTDGEPSRGDVIDVLRDLDPPEAYIPDSISAPVQEMWQPRQQRNAMEATPVKRSPSAWVITSFVLAILSIPTIIVLPVGSMLAFLGASISTICLGVGVFERTRGRWMGVVAQSVFAVHFLLLLGLMLLQL